MKEENIVGQGLQYVTDEVTGKSYPIPAGGSDVPAADSGGEGTVSDGGGTGVQSEAPVDGGQATPSDGGSGQGFLEPYLSDVPEDQRSVVEPILERYRQEQDANFNKRFEKLQEEARVPTTIYNSLLQDPIQTLNWIADRMQAERGLDIRSQLVDQWGNPVSDPGAEQAIAEAQEEQGNKPLTQEDVNRLLEERDKQRQQEAQQEQFQQQQIQKQQETVNSWVDDAAGKFGLGLDDSNGEDPLRAVIIMQANQLHEQGVARGQGAVEMAVESVAKRFGKAPSNNSGNGSGEPRVADGGTPPPAKEIDVSDAKQRKARMEELFTGSPTS